MWDFDVWMGTGHGMLGVSDIVTRLMMMIDELAYVAYRQFPRSSFIVIHKVSMGSNFMNPKLRVSHIKATVTSMTRYLTMTPPKQALESGL